MEQQRRREKVQQFKSFDSDGSGAVDVRELQQGMKAFFGSELSESMASRLLEANDTDKDGLLQPSEFNVDRLQATLEELVAEDSAKETAAWREERKRQDRARRLDAYQAKLPPANEDTGAITRLLSAMVYVLPLLDSLKWFGMPLADVVGESFTHMASPALGAVGMVNAIPYGHLVIFVVLLTLADNRKLPLLLRWNFRQAAVLDVSLVMTQLAQVLFSLAIYGSTPPDLVHQFDSNVIVFLMVVGSVVYSTISSLLGITPDGIPGVSRYVKRYLAPTRPSTSGVATAAPQAAAGEPEGDGSSRL